MALSEDQWLARAKQLAVGMRVRARHLSEQRDNLIIANTPDRWWCYCQRCKEGAVVMKEHVVLGGSGVVDTRLDFPTDVQYVHDSDMEIPVARFLAKKNMDFMYLPSVYISQSRARILLRDSAGCWHGRDCSERSPMKWLNYSGARYAEVGEACGKTVVVEDLFSMYKTHYAVGGHVVCALGTGCTASLVRMLAGEDEVVWFFDADAAGDHGFEEGRRRVRPFVQHQRRARPPEGLDPKDMTCEAIRNAVL